MVSRVLRHVGFGLLLPAVALAAPPPSRPPILPLAEVRPGMEGEGRTVFEGATIESFGVRVLGVLENAVGPRQSMILARLRGGPLAETGVIAGMSGSPVYIDGKLAGALSLKFGQFNKEPLAGVTPIQDILSMPTGDPLPGAQAADGSGPSHSQDMVEASLLLPRMEERYPLPGQWARAAGVPGGAFLQPMRTGFAGELHAG